MAFERAAAVLRIGHLPLPLYAGGRKAWRRANSHPWSSVEAAALAFFQDDGWNGHDGEGGLILSLIKAASFPVLPKRLQSVFIEAIYQQNVAFDEDRFDRNWLVENIRTATPDRITKNFSVMGTSPDGTPEYFPTVTLRKMLDLFAALGNDRLCKVAAIFAERPYDLRAGWPDLTLWREQKVIFREVKAPGDRIHASQIRLIQTLLLPLGLR